MFFIIRQNQDLCSVNGFAFQTVKQALASAEKEIGQRCDALRARVYNDGNEGFRCWIVRPADGFPNFCREGQMTLIADEDEAMPIAMRLSRRNGIYGDAKVEFRDIPERTEYPALAD